MYLGNLHFPALIRCPVVLMLISTNSCTDTSDRLQCLREVPYEQLFDALQPQLYTWTPVVDGDFIPGWPSDRMAAGEFANVTLLIGANTVSFRRRMTNLLASVKSNMIYRMRELQRSMALEISLIPQRTLETIF
jgi:hypothetical protein